MGFNTFRVKGAVIIYTVIPVKILCKIFCLIRNSFRRLSQTTFSDKYTKLSHRDKKYFAQVSLYA